MLGWFWLGLGPMFRVVLGLGIKAPVYLLWALKSTNKTYFGLLGSRNN